MNPSRKGCLKFIISFLVFSMQISASPLQPPQPRFDSYSLPPPPPEKIVEYPVLTPSGAEDSIRIEMEAVPEKAPAREPGGAVAAERVQPPEPRRETENDRTPPSADQKLSNSMESAVRESESMNDVASEVYARLNERFSLALEGASWLFIEAYPSGGIVYDGRVREDQFMRFTFRALKKGKYLLQFAQGNSGGGRGSTHRVAVEVLPGEEFLAKVTGASGMPESDEESSLPSDGEMEFDLSEDERYRAALEHLRKTEWQDAFRVITDSAEFDPSKPSLMTAAAFASALFMDDYMLALDYAGFSASLQKDFTSSILNLGTELPVGLRRRLFTASLDLMPGYHGMDGLVFALARDYEEPGPARGIAEAVRYYRFLLSEYPLSPYWQRARERANYLERHFLLVR